MACSDGIDVQTFHDFDVLYHAFCAHNIASVGVHLMAVSSFDEDRLAVDQQLWILDFNLAEAHFLCDDLLYLALLVFHRSHKGI